MTRSLKNLGLAGCIGALALLCTSTWVMAAGSVGHKVSVVAVASSMTSQNGTTTAKFVLQVTNDDDAAIADFKVAFSPEYSVAVGAVAVGQTVTSGSQTITVETGEGTQSLALPVTYSFSVDGAAVEMPALLTFVRAQ